MSRRLPGARPPAGLEWGRSRGPTRPAITSWLDVSACGSLSARSVASANQQCRTLLSDLSTNSLIVVFRVECCDDIIDRWANRCVAVLFCFVVLHVIEVTVSDQRGYRGFTRADREARPTLLFPGEASPQRRGQQHPSKFGLRTKTRRHRTWWSPRSRPRSTGTLATPPAQPCPTSTCRTTDTHPKVHWWVQKVQFIHWQKK